MKPIQASSLLLVLLVFHTTVAAADPPTFSGPPPGMGEVQLVGDILVLSRGIPRTHYETCTATRKNGDREEEYTYTVSKTVTEIRSEAVAPDDYRILDMQGKPADRTVLADRLVQLTPVLIADDGRRVDPQYLVLYKPDTLIVYLRPQRPQPPHDQHVPNVNNAVTPPPAPAPAPAPVPPGLPT